MRCIWLRCKAYTHVVGEQLDLVHATIAGARLYAQTRARPDLILALAAVVEGVMNATYSTENQCHVL